MCAETFADSVNIQQRKVWNLLPKLETKYAYYDEVNGFRNRKLIWKNGSRIEFKSYDQKREGFQGEDIDLIINDEEPQNEIVKEQRMRLIDRDGVLVFTMTPLSGMTDLIEDLYADHDVIRSDYAPLLGENVPRIAKKNNVMFYSLWSSENPYVSQARIAEEIKLMSRQEIKARIYGIPTNFTGKIYPMFSRDVHVVPWDFIPKTKVTLYHVLDPHDRKPWAMQWWAVDQIGRAFCVREYPWKRNFNEMEFDDKTYADYAKLIKATELELIEQFGRSVSRRIIDPNFGNATERKAEREGGQSKTTPKNELKRLGLHFIDGIDALEAGHLQVRKWLHYELKGVEMVVKPRLFYYEGCENSIRHMSRYARKDLETADGDVKDKAQPMDKYKDFPDCTRYFVMSNPIWQPRIAPELPKTNNKIY